METKNIDFNELIKVINKKLQANELPEETALYFVNSLLGIVEETESTESNAEKKYVTIKLKYNNNIVFIYDEKNNLICFLKKPVNPSDYNLVNEYTLEYPISVNKLQLLLNYNQLNDAFVNVVNKINTQTSDFAFTSLEF